jgi:SAM-dependent methyltransferase
MDNDTAAALLQTVNKWENILNNNGEDNLSLDCPLCHKFFDIPYCCQGCPVALRTGQRGCSGTPHDEWISHHEHEHGCGEDDCRPLTIECAECRRLAVTQLAFLRELLPRRYRTTRRLNLLAPVVWWTKRGSNGVLDSLYGVDTGPDGFGDNPFAYDPAPWRTLKQVMRLASLPAEGFTFVDIGCGKGRVLLSALEFPFRQIIGIELSSTLAKIAEKNLGTARLFTRRALSSEVICGDATEFVTPKGPLIVFFYNPFPLDTMQIVLGNIVRAYVETPCLVYLIFYACSSTITGISEFLVSNTDDHARRLVSTTVGHRSVNIFELP